MGHKGIVVDDLSHISIEREINIEELRQRLGKMTDGELRQFGEASRFMCSPGANLGKPPRDVFVIQLNEARAEWRRRRPGRFCSYNPNFSLVS